MTDAASTTLPIAERDFGFLLFVLALILLTGLVFLLLQGVRAGTQRTGWKARLETEGWKAALNAAGLVLALVWIALFLLAIWAAFFGTYQLLVPRSPAAPAPAPGLGAVGIGTLLGALLGGPFLVWGTWLKHRTVGFQKEGHLTDRISKAVEQLGAEKKVDRIGRPVTIWTGKVERFSCFERLAAKYLSQPRAKVISREYRQIYDQNNDDVEEGYLVSISVWGSERTVIQWQGEELQLAQEEAIGLEGDWKVFSESVPNIEVRMGGILSLERIAQDSTEYDKGRDHVRVMEILCAYIRQNAPASEAKDHGFGEWEPLKDGATTQEREAFEEARKLRFGFALHGGQIYGWAQALPDPRADIAIALRVIGRRSKAQRQAEARWGKDAAPNAEWVFDEECPALPEATEAALSMKELNVYRARLVAWKDRIIAYRGFRLDLRKTNLQRTDLSDLCLSGALMTAARMDGANLTQTRLEGARISEARLDAANLFFARLEGASLDLSRIEQADLTRARMQGCHLWGARLEGAKLLMAHLEGANLREAKTTDANISGTRLEGADLTGARMEGARFWNARLEGANLWMARLDETTKLDGTVLHGAQLGAVNCSNLRITPDQLRSCFGDGSTVLSTEAAINRPPHWPSGKLSPGDLDSEWRKWQETRDS